jgi:hypothetical protein
MAKLLLPLESGDLSLHKVFFGSLEEHDQHIEIRLRDLLLLLNNSIEVIVHSSKKMLANDIFWE